MANPFTLSRLAIGSTVSAVGIYGAIVYRRMSQTQGIVITKTDYDAPTPFRTSPTMRNIVNPRHYPESVMDTRWATLKIPLQYTDEQVLAQFVRGFFGGIIFTPERLLANNVLPKVTQFAALEDTPVPIMARQRNQLPCEQLLPVNSRVVDLFQLTDFHVVDRATDTSGANESFVDFAFGSDNSTFAGAHRIYVSRAPDDPEAVTIGLACIVVNPATGKNMVPPGTAVFHRIYAMLLFRDSLAEITNELQARSN
ncbi:hypothetical protein CC79DRAFT_1323779 [Sarocladium strictum]